MSAGVNEHQHEIKHKVSSVTSKDFRGCCKLLSSFLLSHFKQQMILLKEKQSG